MLEYELLTKYFICDYLNNKLYHINSVIRQTFLPKSSLKIRTDHNVTKNTWTER